VLDSELRQFMEWGFYILPAGYRYGPCLEHSDYAVALLSDSYTLHRSRCRTSVGFWKAWPAYITKSAPEDLRPSKNRLPKSERNVNVIHFFFC